MCIDIPCFCHPIAADFEISLRMKELNRESIIKELFIYKQIMFSAVAEYFDTEESLLNEKLGQCSLSFVEEFALRITGDYELDAHEICIFREALLDAIAEVLNLDVNLLRSTLISALTG